MRAQFAALPIDVLQRHTAYVAVGPTTLRRMGASRREVCDYLGNVNLTELYFNGVPEQLDRWTSSMVKANLGPWGAVRKSINLFLRECEKHHLIRGEFRLADLKPDLELPLDGQTMRYIRKIDRERQDMCKVVPVKALCPSRSANFQAVALAVGRDKKLTRVDLDVLIWNNND